MQAEGDRRTGPNGRENDVSDFDETRRSRGANLNDGYGTVDVLESRAFSCNYRPSLSDNLRPRRNSEGGSHNVGTGIEEDYFTSGELDRDEILRQSFRVETYSGKDSLESCGIVRLPVSLGSLVPNTNKLRHSVRSVLRVGSAKDLPSTVQQRRRLSGRRDRPLRKFPCTIRACKYVSLTPRGDRRRSTSKHNGTTDDSNSSGDVGELDVVQYQRSAELPIAGRRGANKNRGV
jgi:hypothetical protein